MDADEAEQPPPPASLGDTGWLQGTLDTLAAAPKPRDGTLDIDDADFRALLDAGMIRCPASLYTLPQRHGRIVRGRKSKFQTRQQRKICRPNAPPNTVEGFHRENLFLHISFEDGRLQS
jgi:hypothetical protein